MGNKMKLPLGNLTHLITRASYKPSLLRNRSILEHKTSLVHAILLLWYLSHKRAAKVQASLCKRAVSPELHCLHTHRRDVDEGSDKEVQFLAK